MISVIQSGQIYEQLIFKGELVVKYVVKMCASSSGDCVQLILFLLFPAAVFLLVWFSALFLGLCRNC